MNESVTVKQCVMSVVPCVLLLGIREVSFSYLPHLFATFLNSLWEIYIWIFLMRETYRWYSKAIKAAEFYE